MKKFAFILATTLLTAPALATPGGENGNSNCNGQGNPNSFCEVEHPGNGGGIVNNNSNSNSNTIESINDNTSNSNATGGAGGQGGSSSSNSSAAGGQGGLGGQGGQGGQGGKGGQGGHSSATGGNSSASNRNSISNTSNSQSYYERETPIAPLLDTSDSAQMEGITVPLPTIGISGFYSNGDNYWGNSNRNDFGVTLGIRTPLGAGAFRDAAMRREKFQIVKEAIFLQEKGVLTYSAFPEHYIALHGAAPSPTDSPIK